MATVTDAYRAENHRPGITFTALCAPLLLSIIVSPVHKVHRHIWHWYRLSNPDNWGKQAAGYIANKTLGNTGPHVWLTQAVLFAARVSQYVKAQETFERACDDWMNSLQGHRIEFQRTSWVKQRNAIWISPSTDMWIHSHINNIVFRIYHFAVQSLNVTIELFMVTMKMMDAANSMSFSEEARNEGINEFFCNGSQVLDDLVERGEKLKETLKTNPKLVQRLTYALGYFYNPQTVFDTVDQGLNKTAEIQSNIRTLFSGPSSSTGKVILKTGWRIIIDGIASAFRIMNMTPPKILETPSAPLQGSRMHHIKPIPFERITLRC